MQQGKLPEAERAIKTLYGKERVAEVIQDFTAASQGSVEPEAGWSDLFSSRYWKGNLNNWTNFTYPTIFLCSFLLFLSKYSASWVVFNHSTRFTFKVLKTAS